MNGSTTRIVKRLIAATAVLVMGVSLAACEGELPKVSQDTNAEAIPDLTTDQEKAIREKLLADIQKCNDEKNPANLGQAMTGPELQIRQSELQIASKTNELDPKTKIPTDITQTVVPTDNGWPRSVFTITTTTDDQQSKRLLVFTQNSARSNYKLWGLARLFQGVKMPKFAIPAIGAQNGTESDNGLLMTPKQAVERYADVLQNGKNSKYAADFGDDLFRQELEQLQNTVQQGMERNKGSQQQTFTPVNGEMRVMRSADGGDLVVAQINSEWTRSAGEGRESQPASKSEKALFGDGKATSTMRVQYVNVVALYIPPKSNAVDSAHVVTAVGAERQPVKVEAI
ncbi:hypothetical protein D2E26_0058 [Bifidobacterium dolichotidis]|uniref:DUF8094 domain-containing protein n=1 Tax=Bifidobacterium dolichotidis TaxID=2306976 RepID=A0A430FRL9_9BIFI|nr:hypothetical protein [Bifidobacterium dolichotidis]RSX55495.1 hypothetical protein D2E26_0058 [Bifidobacterium dolichotidis]